MAATAKSKSKCTEVHLDRSAFAKAAGLSPAQATTMLRVAKSLCSRFAFLRSPLRPWSFQTSSNDHSSFFAWATAPATRTIMRAS